MTFAAKRAASTPNSIEKEKIIQFSPELIKAPFLLRCAALFIDYIVFLIIPVGWLVTSRLLGEVSTKDGIGIPVWLIGFVLFLGNFVALPLLRGQTLGKMLLGLTILKTDGTSVDLWTLVKRNLLGYIVTILTVGIGFLISAVSPSGRALHDFLAGTYVIRGRKTPI